MSATKSKCWKQKIRRVFELIEQIRDKGRNPRVSKGVTSLQNTLAYARVSAPYIRLEFAQKTEINVYFDR